jgi:hypothetical protein
MTQWVHKECPICGVNYCLDKIYDDYRQDGAKKDDGSPLSWCCPNGHTLVYRENEADKLRRERDNLRQQLARVEDEKREAIAVKDREIKRIKKRSAAGTCPCCQRTFSNMATHMKHKHPDFVQETGAKVIPIKKHA